MNKEPEDFMLVNLQRFFSSSKVYFAVLICSRNWEKCFFLFCLLVCLFVLFFFFFNLCTILIEFGIKNVKRRNITGKCDEFSKIKK